MIRSETPKSLEITGIKPNILTRITRRVAGRHTEPFLPYDHPSSQPDTSLQDEIFDMGKLPITDNAPEAQLAVPRTRSHRQVAAIVLGTAIFLDSAVTRGAGTRAVVYGIERTGSSIGSTVAEAANTVGGIGESVTDTFDTRPKPPPFKVPHESASQSKNNH
jgi:hypothetical protein